MPPETSDEWDSVLWKGSSNGEYTVKSGYKRIMGEALGVTAQFWSLIWNWPGPERIRSFLWLVAHNRLHTNVLRWRRWGDSPKCGICGQIESTMHVLRDCEWVAEVWKEFVPAVMKEEFFGNHLTWWLKSNLSVADLIEERIPWRVFFGVACWKFWKIRNERMFSRNARVVNTFCIKREILNFSMNVKEARVDILKRIGEKEKRKDRHWRPPDVGWVKLNSDGSVKDKTGAAGCGGVCRDHTGKWVFGYAKRVGICKVEEAELWGIFEGLQLCWEAGFRKVVLESDSEVSIRSLQVTAVRNVVDSNLLIKVRELLGRNWEVSVRHVYREGNKCADALARRSFDLSMGVHVWNEVIPSLRKFLERDCMVLSVHEGS